MMKRIKKALLSFMLLTFGLSNLCVFNLVSAAWSTSAYDQVLDSTLDSRSLSSVENPDVVKDKTWVWLFTEQVKTLTTYIIDIFIVIWIAVAFLGGYTVMTSDSEDKMKEGMRLIIFGVLWVIIMMSANFLAEWLVWEDGIITGQFDSAAGDNPSWVQMAQKLYEKIMFPFIKMALYLATWALFIVMAAKVITFAISTDETAKKKAWWIIIWCVVWIFIIMWSKQLVEAVFGKQDAVLNDKARWIDEVWNPLPEFHSIQLISQVINWVMGLTMFVVVVLIIIQGYRMFTKPDDPKNRERLKKTLLYVLIWILVIWASYVISNIVVLNWFTSTDWI